MSAQGAGMLIWSFVAAAASLCLPTLARASSTIDAAEDGRLALRVSIRARHTTVGQVLSEVARVTGVRLRAASEDVAEQGIAVFVRDRRLDSVMRLLVAEFEWGQEGSRYGWFWTRKRGGSGFEYELHKDLSTRRLPETMRLAERKAFAAELSREIEQHKPAENPAGVRSMDVLAGLPGEALARALTGSKVVLRWSECPETTRRHAAHWLAGVTVPDERTWVEVSTVGEGRSLGLKVYFRPWGLGGVALTHRPRASAERYLQSVLGSDPAKPREYSGTAARPLTIEKPHVKTWLETHDLPTALGLIAERVPTEFISDDYGYVLDWQRPSAGLRGVPSGEPLGLWLDSLGFKLQIPGNPFHSEVSWREREGCLLLRNDNWFADETLAPRPALTAWLRSLERQRPGGSLTLQEAVQLLSKASDDQLAVLAFRGMLPGGLGIASRRKIILFWNALDAGRRRKLLSDAGLRGDDLTPAQRALATLDGPEASPVITERVLSSLGGRMTLHLRPVEHGFDAQIVTPARELAPVRIDLRLRDPSRAPECVVEREAASKSNGERAYPLQQPTGL